MKQLAESYGKTKCLFVNLDLSVYFLSDNDYHHKKPCGFKYMGKLYTYNEEFKQRLNQDGAKYIANSPNAINKAIPYKIFCNYFDTTKTT